MTDGRGLRGDAYYVCVHVLRQLCEWLIFQISAPIRRRACPICVNVICDVDYMCGRRNAMPPGLRWLDGLAG